MIKYFDHQGPKIVRVLREIAVRVFEHFGITTWKGIYQMWMFVKKLLNGKVLIKFSNVVLSCKEIARGESGDQWGLGEPSEDVCLENFWAFYNTNDIVCDGEEITAKDRYIFLYKALWFIMCRSICNKHYRVFDEYIYYVRNDIQKHFLNGNSQVLWTCAWNVWDDQATPSSE